jgi:phosphorylcholine metabolism protein LicD
MSKLSITELKEIMKQVNEPNEFILTPYELEHPFYWIFEVKNLRVKIINKNVEHLRKHGARFDVFINGLFISENDYIVEQRVNNLYIKFKRNNFPAEDRFGNPYQLESSDEVKINGDLERIKNII